MSNQDDKRYNLRIQQALYDEIGKIAESNGTSLLEALKTLLKVGVTVYHAQESGATVQFVNGDEVEAVKFIF